jgi:hypothetical protein
MRVPFFWSTLPMLLPAVPASVSATDSHISPMPIRSPAPCGVHLPAGIWGHPSFLLNFFSEEATRGRARRGRWLNRGILNFFWAARPCPRCAGWILSNSGRSSSSSGRRLMRPLLGGDGGRCGVCGTGRRVSPSRRHRIFYSVFFASSSACFGPLEMQTILLTLEFVRGSWQLLDSTHYEEYVQMISITHGAVEDVHE